ncbi:MAG: histidine ammonia-lyase [Planctomycetes bacterium]|nr:histidine ammonia-lyase [Planctomycetota bacterium]
MRYKVILHGNSLNWQDIKTILFSDEVTITPKFSKRFDKSYNDLQRHIKQNKTIYGVNTGFGRLSDVRIEPDKILSLQINLLRSHATSVGKLLPKKASRLMLVLRINSLLNGFSAVSRDLIDALCYIINKGITPVIPIKGSVGASGDLSPLAHMALVVIGEGKVEFKGKFCETSELFKNFAIEQYQLKPKEGVALINGMQFTLAYLFDNLLQLEKILTLSELTASMTVDALKCSRKPFHDVVVKSRPTEGAQTVCRNILEYLEGSQILKSHETEQCPKVQDQYSIRCIPQIHGVVRDVFNDCLRTCLSEANSTTDNPLISEAGEIISAGNFHGQLIAQRADSMRIAVSTLTNIIERRIDSLVNPTMNDLPPFLSNHPGLHNGMMTVQILAASLAAANRVLSSPASNQTIPTTGGKEDIVSMAPASVEMLAHMIENCWYALSCELICACEALEYRRPLKSSPVCENLHKFVRKNVGRLKADRSLSTEIEALTRQIKSYSF